MSDGVVPLPAQSPLIREGITPERARTQRSAVQKVKCVALKGNGDPCRNWAVKGCRVCLTHGGRKNMGARVAADAKLVQDFTARLNALAEKGLDVLEEVMDDPEDQKVQLAAAKDVLDRTGHGAVARTANVNVNVDVPGQSVDQDIESYLQRMAERRAQAQADD